MPAANPVVVPAPPAGAPPPPVADASEDHGPEPTSVPPAVSPADAEHLGNRIAALASRIHAATYELLVLIRDFDVAGAWSGFPSCAVWLSWRTGLAPGRGARARAGRPRAGATAEGERRDAARAGLLLEGARHHPGGDTRDRAVAARRGPGGDGCARRAGGAGRGGRRTGPPEARTRTGQRQANRSLHTWVDDDGMVVVRGRLTPEVGSVFRRALEAAVAVDLGATAEGGAMANGRRRGGDRRCRDGAGGRGGRGGRCGAEPRDSGRRTRSGRLAECALAGGLDQGTAGDRYQVVLHVDAETLTEDARPSAAEAGCGADGGGADGADGLAGVPAGTPRPVRRATGCPGPRAGRQAALAEDGGIRVGQETARRIACDAATVTLQHGPDGGVLDVGRRTRTVSPALRRALAARDGQCRFPGCEARRCDAHHVRHWADGGETALANLVLLCRRHHRAVHEEGFRVHVDGGAIGFLRPDGRPLPEAPDAPDWEGPALAPVDRRLADAGLGIDAETAPRWQGEPLDVGWAIDVLWRPRAGAHPRPAFPRKRPDRDRRRKP